MRCDGCSSLSLLAGMLVTPADPFVRPARLRFARRPGVALGSLLQGRGLRSAPPHAPLPGPLPGCSPFSLHISSHRRPQLRGQTRCCSARAEQGQEPLKQKPTEGSAAHPGSSGAAAPCPALALGIAPTPPPRLPLPLTLSLPFIFYVTYIRLALFLALPGRRHMSLFRVIHFAAFASNRASRRQAPSRVRGIHMAGGAGGGWGGGGGGGPGDG